MALSNPPLNSWDDTVLIFRSKQEASTLCRTGGIFLQAEKLAKSHS